ncbi:MAG: hypothetical protein QOG77_2339, partial [Solirubrobacteraceae bacterium]|nr:hypothetical protein [Solirubrobacteraceae bacterium]
MRIGRAARWWTVLLAVALLVGLSALVYGRSRSVPPPRPV